MSSKAKRAKVEKAKKEPKSKKESKSKKDGKTKAAKEPKAKKEAKPKKTPKEKSTPKTQVAKNSEPADQKRPQPKTKKADLGDASDESRTDPSSISSQKEKSSENLPEENAPRDGFVPTPPVVDQDESPINEEPDANKENRPEDYDDFEEFMDQVKTEPEDDYEHQLNMEATQNQMATMIGNIHTAVSINEVRSILKTRIYTLQALGNRRSTRQRNTRNLGEDSDSEFSEKPRKKNPVRRARGTGKKALTKRAPKGSKAALKKV